MDIENANVPGMPPELAGALAGGPPYGNHGSGCPVLTLLGRARVTDASARPTTLTTA